MTLGFGFCGDRKESEGGNSGLSNASSRVRVQGGPCSCFLVHHLNPNNN